MSDKTEKPTDKRLRDARKDGQVSRSQDLAEAMPMAATVLLLGMLAHFMQKSIHTIAMLSLDFVHADHSLTSINSSLYRLFQCAVWVIAPFYAFATIASLSTSIAQVKFHVSMKAVSPRFEAVNPKNGIKRIFSLRSLIESIKMIVKATIVVTAIFALIYHLLSMVVASSSQLLSSISELLWAILIKFLAASATLFVMIGLIDVKLQRFFFMRQMRMSKEEVKREYKEQEGDPMLKVERRRLAREWINSRPPAKRVQFANMLMVNPTHYAVAIRYEKSEHPLPRVIAKGMDEAAADLRQAARAARIPIIGHPPVARALYKVDVDEPIPEVLFETVAAILQCLNGISQNHASTAN
jgi:type III secretion protein U